MQAADDVNRRGDGYGASSYRDEISVAIAAYLAAADLLSVEGEPVAWMIHDRGLRHRWTTMADPLTKDDATASLIHAHPDRYTITPLYPGPVQEASSE